MAANFAFIFIVPILIVFLGATAKKLVRKSPFVVDDFFVGIELALAAITTCILHIYDLVQSAVGATKLSNIYDQMTVQSKYTLRDPVMATQSDTLHKGAQSTINHCFAQMFNEIMLAFMALFLLVLVAGIHQDVVKEETEPQTSDPTGQLATGQAAESLSKPKQKQRKVIDWKRFRHIVLMLIFVNGLGAAVLILSEWFFRV